MLARPQDVVLDLTEKALAYATTELTEVGTPYAEARQVELAIEYLAAFDDKVRESILALMWRMERDQLFLALGAPNLVGWAQSNPKIGALWSHETIDRYAKAISRILPSVEAEPLILESGEIIRAEELLQQASISALSDYSFTYSNTEDPVARKAILESILRHDGEDQRDVIMAEIRQHKQHLPTVVVYTESEQDTITFKGSCTPQQWAASMSLLRPFWEEHFSQPYVVEGQEE